MSWNITVDVAEDGTATLDTTASYTQTARPGRYVLSGHDVPDGEGGAETIGGLKPGGFGCGASQNVPTPTE